MEPTDTTIIVAWPGNNDMWAGQALAVEAQASDGIAPGKTVLSIDYIGAKMAWPLRSAVRLIAFQLLMISEQDLQPESIRLIDHCPEPQTGGNWDVLARTRLIDKSLM